MLSSSEISSTCGPSLPFYVITIRNVTTLFFIFNKPICVHETVLTGVLISLLSMQRYNWKKETTYLYIAVSQSLTGVSH